MSLSFLELPRHIEIASVLADTGGALFLVMIGMGILATLLVYVVAIVIEALVMRYLEWDFFWRCLLDSWIINTVSIVAGIVLVWFSIRQPSFLIRFLFLTETALGILTVFAGAWAISVGLEGGTLWVIRRKPARVTWQLVVFINVASYVVLVILYLILERVL